ncbi:MAG: GTP-binding protein, partial [Thermodesulfobacteriota bacterium]
MPPTRVIIMGAAGRDFHNFNVYFRDNPAYRVVAFTAAQIPNIEGRTYPPSLAGTLYPNGIPVHPEQELVALIHAHSADEVVFAYSDVTHEYVMHLASQVLISGADFRLMGTGTTTLQSNKPVVSVCAVRTGSGKSQTSRRVASLLRQLGHRVGVVRHPMPYGDLSRQAVQRFASDADLDLHECSIEEREEYEPHLALGAIVYAGIDYRAVLSAAESEVDIIVWDGGNNDLPFFRSDLHIVVVDPLRAGHELRYHPGEANVRSANLLIINKIDTAEPADVEAVRRNLQILNPLARVIEAASPIQVEDPAAIRDRRVLVVEDGPTLTHGGMSYGAGWIAAQRFQAREIVD